MEIFWAVIISIILLLVIYGIFSANLAAKKALAKPVAIGDLTLARLSGVFDPQKLYLVTISSGTRFEGVKLIGYTDPGEDSADVGVASRRWLILEASDGKRVFVNPFRISWVKEV